MKKTKLKYKRVLLKLSGEIFGKENGKGVSITSYMNIAKKIAKIKKDNKIDLAIVVGGGNIFRGRENGEERFSKAIADNMGMMGTIINAMGLQEALEDIEVPARAMTAIKMDSLAEQFILKRALRHFDKDRVLIFAGGTGNPFFTTDSAAALRACEINADLILKATNVNGVYDSDPDLNSKAKLYENISYKEALEKDLNIMDATAFALCSDQKKPVIVFNVNKIEEVTKAFRGEKFGTLVS